MRTFTDKYSHFILRVYILQLRGKDNAPKRVNRIAYAVATPCESNIVFKNMRDFNRVGSCDSYKCYMSCFKMADTRQKVLSIVKDLCEGQSLPDILSTYGIERPDQLDFDLKLEGKVFDIPWGIESALGSEIICTNMVCLDEVNSLFKYGNTTPEQMDKVRGEVAAELEKQTNLPFTGLYSEHVGNIEIIVQPDREPRGRALVRLNQDKDNGFEQIVEIDAGQSQYYDRFYVNYSIWKDGRIIIDELLSKSTVVGKETVFSKKTGEPIDRLEVKVWGEENDTTILISKNKVVFIKQILVSSHVIGSRFKANYDWLENIRKSMPANKQSAVDAAAVTEHTSSENYVVGNKTMHRTVNKAVLPKLKDNDVFFHDGWNPETQEQGGLLFLEWFRSKTQNAKSVFLQDPYFEDVALYMMATSNSECSFTVLTQTKLITNSDNTASFSSDDESKRGEKILEMIQSYPTLFNDIKLVVKDLDSGNNILHDRYLVIIYEDQHTEAYSLSNSLQGATRKQPILITQIGDDAFEQVKKHINKTIESASVVTLYDYSIKLQLKTSNNKEIADEKYYKRLVEHKAKGDWLKFACRTLNCCFENRFCTFGLFLAKNDRSDDEDMPYGIMDAINNKGKFVFNLKNFIINNYEKEFPLGYGKTRGLNMFEVKYISWFGKTYDEIVNHWSVHDLDFVGEDCADLRVWGQFYASKLLCKSSIADFVSIMQMLEPVCAKVDSDRAAASCVKMLNVLMNEAFYMVIRENDLSLLVHMLKQKDSFCRALASLMLIYKTKNDSFDLEQYKQYFTEPNEIITLCVAALGSKPDVSHKDRYYEWLLDALTLKNDKQVAIQCILSFVIDSHVQEDKRELLQFVAVPLCEKGLIDYDEFASSATETLYDTTINKEINVLDVLPLTLEIVNGSLNTLINKGEKTLSDNQRESNNKIVEKDDDLFCRAQPLLELRSLLSEVCNRCKSADSDQLNEIKKLHQRVEDELKAMGKEKDRSTYDICKYPLVRY